jgi:hypothetical protein
VAEPRDAHLRAPLLALLLGIVSWVSAMPWVARPKAQMAK